MPANVKLYDGTLDPEDHLSRFSFAANSGEWPMPVWCCMFQQMLDGSARGWFEHLLAGSIDGCAELRKQFTTRFSTRRACFKDLTEITKIVKKVNETLDAFKERWIVETSFIVGVPEVMKISSFMDAQKCPELAKRYFDKVPKMVDEMMIRLVDFIRSEEAFANTELPKGEISEASKKWGGPAPRGDHQGYHHLRLNLSALTKHPKEILALDLQLNLPPPRPMQLPPKKENQDRYYDYHREKGLYTNDCYQLKGQLESALESRKLNYLIKYIRQRGRENSKGRDGGKDVSLCSCHTDIYTAGNT
ncbi:hypothetical protein Tco_0491051 [Tanacetum coccineum]